MNAIDEVLERVAAVLAAIENDDAHGGLLSRQTLRRASELRLALGHKDAVAALTPIEQLDEDEPDIS